MSTTREKRRAARTRQIVDAARTCFAANGFHVTSMDDIIRESGLSAGAVYRYFRSKDELITAAASQSLAELGGIITELVESQPPPSPEKVLMEILTQLPFRDNTAERKDLSTMVLHGWSESARNPEFRLVVQGGYASLVEKATPLLEHWHREGLLEPDVDIEALGQVLLAMIQGFIVQQALASGTTPERFAHTAAAMFSRGPK